jgi:hypothetical protein
MGRPQKRRLQPSWCLPDRVRVGERERSEVVPRRQFPSSANQGRAQTEGGEPVKAVRDVHADTGFTGFTGFTAFGWRAVRQVACARRRAWHGTLKREVEVGWSVRHDGRLGLGERVGRRRWLRDLDYRLVLLWLLGRQRTRPRLE